MSNKELARKIITKLTTALGLILVFLGAAAINKPYFPVSTDLGCTPPGVAIDPGHGGYDGGATWGGVVEKNINLEISLSLRELLLAAGYRVVMTRYGDYSLVEQAQTKKREDMVRRLAVIEQFQPDYFLCIHCNAMASTLWWGGQAFCQHESALGQELATDIQSYLVHFTDTKRHASSLDHFLLRECSATGCLIEAGFLSHVGDRELLQQKSYQRRLAVAAWLGLVRFAADSHKISGE